MLFIKTKAGWKFYIPHFFIGHLRKDGQSLCYSSKPKAGWKPALRFYSLSTHKGEIVSIPCANHPIPPLWSLLRTQKPFDDDQGWGFSNINSELP